MTRGTVGHGLAVLWLVATSTGALAASAIEATNPDVFAPESKGLRWGLLVAAALGALARLLFDAATETYSCRRQVGFLLMSMATAIAVTAFLWELLAKRPTALIAADIGVALLGPVDALAIVRGLLQRLIGTPPTLK